MAVSLNSKLSYKSSITLSKEEEKFFVTLLDSPEVVFLGDLFESAPRWTEVLKLIKDRVYSGIAFCFNGKHDNKLKGKQDIMSTQIKT